MANGILSVHYQIREFGNLGDGEVR